MKDVTGQPILSITYSDENGWPVSADGHGDSLQPVNLQRDPNNPKNWQAGSPSPGQVEP